MWDELGIAPCDDPKVIRRAYALCLKKLDPDRDPESFTRLREALEWALAEADEAPPGRSISRGQLGTDEVTEKIGAHGEASLMPPSRAVPNDGDSTPDVLVPIDEVAAPPQPEWLDPAAGDAVLGALESALARRAAAEAMQLFRRATAMGAVPLLTAEPLLERIFAVAVEDISVDGAAFRDLAGFFGWDKPTDARGLMSAVRQRVLARLAAEDWYATLRATAARPAGVKRKQARLARLMLRQIGRFRLPRVDPSDLKVRLDEARRHEEWLCDRIDPKWVRLLERRSRRREFFWISLITLFLGVMTINGARLFVSDVFAGTISPAGVLIAPYVAIVLLWVLKLSTTALYQLAMVPAESFVSGPPPDLKARLGWLERQAELAYQAMYDASDGSTSTARYSDAKEFLADAIALAHRLGQAATAERLSLRLAEIKAVFRSQFSI